MELFELEQFSNTVLERYTEIKNKTKNMLPTYPIEFMGKNTKLPVIQVRLGFPVYRLANGRTSTYQLEYLELHPDLDRDFFAKDNDASSAQIAQHEVLERLVEEEGLLKAFRNEENQIQPIICTNTGVVVNGNRRLCAWRKLYLQDSTKYKSFQTIEIAILPECDEKAIVELEEKLQIQKEKRAEYKWHAKAMMAQRREMSGARHGDVARNFDMSPQALTVLLEAKDYAEEYLNRIGKPNQWSLIDKDRYAFEKLAKNIKRLTNQGDRELFLVLVYNLISNSDDAGERLYDVVDKVYRHFDALKKRFEQSLIGNSDDGGLQNDNDLDILAGEPIQEDQGSKIAAELQDTNEEGQIRIIKDIKAVIDTQEALLEDAEESEYLLTQLSKAASYITAAVDRGLHDKTSFKGVEKQIRTIKDRINDIEEWMRGIE